MQTKSLDTPVQNPDLYDHIYRTYGRYIFRMVNLLGVPLEEVEDSVSNILVRMMAKDGMAKFEGPPTRERIRKFVASYVRLGARNEQERVLTHRDRFLLVPIADDQRFRGPEPPPPVGWDGIMAVAFDLRKKEQADAAHYIEVCSQHQNHRESRNFLISEGWNGDRIGRAVMTARKAVKAYLRCTKS